MECLVLSLGSNTKTLSINNHEKMSQHHWNEKTGDNS